MTISPGVSNRAAMRLDASLLRVWETRSRKQDAVADRASAVPVRLKVGHSRLVNWVSRGLPRQFPTFGTRAQTANLLLSQHLIGLRCRSNSSTEPFKWKESFSYASPAAYSLLASSGAQAPAYNHQHSGPCRASMRLATLCDLLACNLRVLITQVSGQASLWPLTVHDAHAAAVS